MHRAARRDADQRRLRNHRAASILAAATAIGIAILVALPGGEPRKPIDPKHSVKPASDAIEARREFDVVIAPPIDGPAPTLADMTVRLVRLGDWAIPFEIEALCGELELPEFAPTGTATRVHPIAIQLREAAIREALRRLPPASVIASVRDHATPKTTLDVRLALARILGEVDSEDAIDALGELASGIDEPSLQHSFVRTTLEEALTRRIERAARIGVRLQRLFARSNHLLWPMIARAAGRSNSAEAAWFLVFTLGREIELDVESMRALAALSDRIGVVLPEHQLAEVRRALGAPDDRVQRTAAAVLGRLHDRGSVPSLIATLENRDALIAAAAHGALRSIAGLDLGAERDGWQRWYDHELDWWDETEPRIDTALESDDPGAVFGATSELLSHATFAREAAAKLGPLALEGDERIASIALDALARLGSPYALPALVDALAREDALGERAGDLLRKLTHFGFPTDSTLWRAVVAPNDLH